MERAMILEHLAMAERHVTHGAEHVRTQREIVDRLRQGGHDVSIAIALLHQLEETQRLHITDRDRLRAELLRINEH